MKELISITDYSNFINEVLDKSIIKYRIKKAVEENIIIEDDESPVEEEKCGKPKHISELPGDLRTTDLDKLIDRFDACKTRMRELGNELKGLESDLNSELDTLVKDRTNLNKGIEDLKSMALENEKFYELDDKIRVKKLDWINNVADVLRDYDIKGKGNDIDKLRQLFKETSWVEPDDAKWIKDFGDKIMKYTPSNGSLIRVSEDIKKLASNDYFDKDLPKLHDNLHVEDLLTTFTQVNQLSERVNKSIDIVEELGVQIEQDKQMYLDYQNESLNTVRRAGNLGLLD